MLLERLTVPGQGQEHSSQLPNAESYPFLKFRVLVFLAYMLKFRSGTTAIVAPTERFFVFF